MDQRDEHSKNQNEQNDAMAGNTGDGNADDREHAQPANTERNIIGKKGGLKRFSTRILSSHQLILARAREGRMKKRVPEFRHPH